MIQSNIWNCLTQSVDVLCCSLYIHYRIRIIALKCTVYMPRKFNCFNKWHNNTISVMPIICGSTIKLYRNSRIAYHHHHQQHCARIYISKPRKYNMFHIDSLYYVPKTKWWPINKIKMFVLFITHAWFYKNIFTHR